MMFLRMIPIALFVGLPLFVSAGTWEVPAFLAYVLMLWLMFSIVYTVAQRRAPDTVKERLAPPSDRDKASRRMTAPLLLAHYVAAGLDARFGWTVMPLALQVAGFAIVFGGLMLSAWVIFSNPFASTAVRIQEERNQVVISTGPYAWVRHPMYLGVFLAVAGSGIALGSWVAGAILLPVVMVFARRTLVEDHLLHSELRGYPEYARRVRWKVVPGVF